MRRANVVLAVVILASLLVACGPGDSPEKAAQEWTEALLNLDGNKLAERTCAVQQANVQSAAIWASAFAVLGQQFTGQHVEADISDLRFDTISRSGNNAQVRVYGEIRTAVLAIAQTTQVDTTYAMVQESGKWKWCGEVGGVEAATPTPPSQQTPVVEVATPTPATQPTPVGEMEPELIAYGYEVKDAGEGWNVGTVHLAFKNTSDVIVPPGLPLRSQGYHDVKNAFVETEEGKTYPVKVSASFGLLGHFEGGIDLRAMPGIPPGFRLKEGLTEIGEDTYAWGRLVLEFKFAQAAHPTVIKFPARPDWTIRLAEATEADWEMPTDLPASSFKSINTLDGTVLLNEPGKLLVTLGECVVFSGAYGSAGHITYTAVNRDQFDEASANVQFPVRAFLHQGEMWYEDEMTIEVRVGPGQTKQDSIPVFSWAGQTTHLIIYWPDGRYDVYPTNDCTPEEELVRAQATAVAQATATAAAPFLSQLKDAGRIAFQVVKVRHLSAVLYIMNADGSNRQELLEMRDGIFDISPDGNKIASEGGCIYTMQGDTVNCEIGIYSPDWSSDGRRIVWSGGRKRISISNADLTGWTVLYGERCWAAVDPAWSPNDELVTFSLNLGWGDHPDIYVINGDGSNLRPLTEETAENFEPEWSPDGRYIAFQSNRDGGVWGIHVMDADGSHVRRLTNPEQEAERPEWSPDGRWIAYMSGGDIYVTDFEGSVSINLTNTPDIEEVFPVWLP